MHNKKNLPSPPMTPEIRRLIFQKKDFTIKKTLGTLSIILGGKIYDLKKLPSPSLGLFLTKQVRIEAAKFLEQTPELKEKKDFNLSYFNSNKNIIYEAYDLNKEFEGVAIDITAAYWETAKALFLSENTYLKGIPKPTDSPEQAKLIKMYRLKALGSLAMKTNLFSFENGDLTNYELFTEPTAPIWKQIVENISNLMQNIQDWHENCLGYWVDCVFVKDGYDDIINVIEKNNYNYKIKKLIFKIAKGSHACNYLDKKNLFLQAFEPESYSKINLIPIKEYYLCKIY